jgi:hypothetical protein
VSIFRPKLTGDIPQLPSGIREANPAYNPARFDVPFTDGTPTDVSSYATAYFSVGAEATFSANGLRVFNNAIGAFDCRVFYSPTQVSRTTAAVLVIEFYVTWTTLANVTNNSCVTYFSDATYNHFLGFFSNGGSFGWSTGADGNGMTTTSAIPSGTRTKVTLRMETDGTSRLYLNDVLETTRSLGVTTWTLGTVIFGYSGSSQVMDYLVDDVSIWIGEPDPVPYLTPPPIKGVRRVFRVPGDLPQLPSGQRPSTP